MIEQLVVRLNEMDDMMDMVSEGTIHTVELKEAQNHFKNQDRAYIESKLEALQHHAETVLEHIYDQAKQFDESETSDSKLTESQRGMKAFLMQQLDNIEAVLKHLEAAEVHKRDFTFEEYEMLYNALRLGHPDTEAFKAEEEHLPFLNAAMQRQKADEYRQYDLTNKLQDLNQIYGTKDETRRTFEAKLAEISEQHPATNRDAYGKSLITALSELPDHCLKSVSHYSVMKWGGWALIASQMLSAYLATTALVVAPKED